MGAAGESLRRAQVAAVYLLHGTFIGHDAFGFLGELSRYAPELANVLRDWNKGTLDRIVGDFGNFPAGTAERWEEELNDAADRRVPVRLFHWSSENHHLGRADGAVHLLAELRRLSPPSGSRVLLVGHSHGGNVLALVTNLLGADRAGRERFFQAARAYYRLPLWGRIDQPVWEETRQWLMSSDEPLPHVRLDVVTLGAPIRYGWDTGVCEKLLHFVAHRPAAGLPEHHAPFPPTAHDLWHATHGDFVQQAGIAGTNALPPLWSWRACDAEIRLGTLLQPDQPLGELLSRLRCGMRAHAEGENLLVDYGPIEGGPQQHLFGHAVYTRDDWRLFHVEQIVGRFYGAAKQ